MNKKNILILLTIVIIVFIILLRITVKNKDNNIPKIDEHAGGEEWALSGDETWIEETNPSTYFAVCNATNTYFDILFKINQEKNVNKEAITNYKEAINLILKEYFTEFNMNTEQREEWLKKYKDVKFEISRVYERRIENGGVAFYVTGTLTNTKQTYSLIIVADINNNYIVLPMEYIEKHFGSNVLEQKEFNLDSQNIQIRTTQFNTLKYEYISPKDMALKYFEDYKSVILSDTQKAYEMLDDEYKKQKFDSYEKFEKYIKSRKENIENIEITYLRNSNYNNGTLVYICMDSMSNYYIFKAKATMNYNVILDNYTIDLPDFIKKYDSADLENKIELNINKIISAIDAQDYDYIYNCTEKNNFKTKTQFENFCKEHFIKDASIKTNLTKTENGGYICKFTIKDMDKNDEDIINASIELKEDRKFEITFEI